MQAMNESDVHQKPLVNVLLLGQTGVGKSTFINSLVNYLSFDEMDDAEARHPKIVIPVSLVCRDNGKEVPITCGKDENEVHQHAGQSVTQGCKCYQIPFENYVLNLIDTPGVADTRGFDVDKRNFQDILTVIEPFEVLHGICIFLTPNEHRLTATFQFCLNYIFTQLSKSAAKNILFIFTHSRGTFYEPGETDRILRPEIEKLKHQEIPIKFDDENCFYVDNECLPVLLSMTKGISVSEAKKAACRQSWNQTKDECLRMMEYLTQIEPYDLRAMMSINEARLTIDNLSKPLSEIIENLEENKKVLQEQKKQIDSSSSDMERLKKQLKIKMLDILKVPLKHKAIVCCSEDCREVHDVAGIKKPHYPVCQDVCHLDSLRLETRNLHGLLNAPVILADGRCKKCKCSHMEHMLTMYQTKYKVMEVEDPDTQNALNSAQSVKMMAEQKVKFINRRLEELEDEKNVISGAMAKFAHFLNTNALVPYDNSFVRYLTELRENEKKRGNAEAIRRLDESLEHYERQIKLLQDSASGGSQEVTLEEVYQLKEDLFRLPNYGSKIKAFQEIEEDQKKMVAKDITRLAPVQVDIQASLYSAFNSKNFSRFKRHISSAMSNLLNSVRHVNLNQVPDSNSLSK